MSKHTNRSHIAHLIADYTHTIRDPLWRDIPLSDGFKELFSCEPMQKLSRIKQLGPAHLVYPGAVHTRLDHSLGVFHATRLIMISLLTQAQAGESDFHISFEGMQALLTAALLHDMGHFPYAHALKDCVTKEHEHLGAQLIAQDDIIKSIVENSIGTSIDAVCQIIDTTIPCDSSEINFLRTILSGTLDPDKLDYLSRDALFCGIPYGMQDASYIIRNLLVPHFSNQIAIPIEAIGAVEHLLFAKYSMYRNVYWHQATRSATAMIKKAVHLGLQENQFPEHSLFGQDDESFAQLLTQVAHSPTEQLFSAVRSNSLLVPKATLQYVETPQNIRLYWEQSERTHHEQEVWRALRPHYPQLREYEIIIDIPEDVSFESDIAILTEQGEILPFNQVDELFTSHVVETFTSSLRKIRVYAPRYIDSQHLHSIATGILTHESQSR
jgi:HD superfamily phosphohydrolase